MYRVQDKDDNSGQLRGDIALYVRVSEFSCIPDTRAERSGELYFWFPLANENVRRAKMYVRAAKRIYRA